MPYTQDQIGQIRASDFTKNTKSRIALVIIQHDKHPGHDETHLTILCPVDHSDARLRVLEMVSRGIDLNDIRIVRAPYGYAGNGDGLPLEPVSKALLWTSRDDFLIEKHSTEAHQLTEAEYAGKTLAGEIRWI